MSETGDARERLLAAAVEHVAANGVGDPSLRQLATALGTSHRMLIYHFGSKDGLLVEVVRSLEQYFQQMVQDWITADLGVLTPMEELRRIWRFVTDPSRAPYPYERLFFELYGHALQGRSHAAEFLEGNVDAWLNALSAIFRAAGLAPKAARDESRLAVAVFRGLTLDFLATDDVAATDRAMELYLSQVEARLNASARGNKDRRPSRQRRRAS